MSGLMPVTGAAGGGPGPAGRRAAGPLLDRSVPVRALAPTQDHRAEQPRQPGAGVASGDPREIADVESWGAPILSLTMYDVQHNIGLSRTS